MVENTNMRTVNGETYLPTGTTGTSMHVPVVVTLQPQTAGYIHSVFYVRLPEE